MWFVGCRCDHLPESLTLCYSDCDAGSGDPVLPIANEHLQYSETETADYQEVSRPLSAGMCKCSNTAVDETVCADMSDNGNREDMQFVCLEAASVNALTTAAAAADDDDADDGGSSSGDHDTLCDSHDSLYRLICSRLQSTEDADEKRRLCDSLRILLQFFEAEYLVSCTESPPSFPLCLIEQYTKLIKDDVSFYSTDG